MPIVVIGLIAILSGLFTWQFGSPGVHIGASGVMYGLVPYLIFIGLRKGGVFIALAVVIAVLMGFSTLMSILPVPQVSWEMHLGGILAGTALGLIMPADQ